MGFLPASELAAITATVTAALDLTCVIQRKHPVRDAFGSQSDGYSTLATTTCNLTQPSPALMQNYAAEIGPSESWLVRLPNGQDVQRDDQLIVGGVTMRVQIVLQPQSYSTSTRVLAATVR